MAEKSPTAKGRDGSAMVNELEAMHKGQLATSPVFQASDDVPDLMPSASESKLRKKRRLLKATRPSPLECIPENNFESLQQILEKKQTLNYSATKKHSREVMLQQEIRGMKKEKNLNILESIQKQEARAEERKGNRLEQIMEKVKYQRNQYSTKKVTAVAIDAMGDLKINTNISRPETGRETFSRIPTLSVAERDNSRDESIGDSTRKYTASLSGTTSTLNSINMTAKFRPNKIDFDGISKIRPSLEELNPSAKVPVMLKQKPLEMPKINFEISLLRERKLLVDVAESTCKPSRKKSLSFSIDVGHFDIEYRF